MIPLSSVKLVIDIMNNVAGRVLKNKSEEFEYYVTNVFYEAKNINNNYIVNAGIFLTQNAGRK